MSDPKYDHETWLNLSGPLAWLWMILLAAWGGAVRYLAGLRGRRSLFSFSELFIEMFVSAFIGLVTWFLCSSANFSEYFTATSVAVTGHMGTRAIMLLRAPVQAAMKGPRK